MSNPLLVTLDNNCIIALENGEEPNAAAMRKLITFQQEDIIKIVVSWSTMLEAPRQGEEPLWFPEQKHRMETLGLGDAELFRVHQTMWFRDKEGFLTYEPEIMYLRAVHEALFPNIDFNFFDYLERCSKQRGLEPGFLKRVAFYSDPATRIYSRPAEQEQRAAIEQELVNNPQIMQTYRKIYRNWRNCKNDALGLCAHISWGGDVFVTDDGHFYRDKLRSLVKEKLRSLVRGKILNPKDAVQELLFVTGTS